MKKLATAIAAIALIGTPAFAQAPPPAPAPVYNWTGWYAGLNFGVGIGTSNNATTTSTSLVDNLAQFFPGTTPSGSLAGANSGIARVNQNGPIAGGQFGYNWQFSPLIVVGFEADIQGADISGLGNNTGTATESFAGSSAPASVACAGGVCTTGTGFFKAVATANSAEALAAAWTNAAISASGIDSVTADVRWLGTVRARAGYLITPNLLLYATGGLAYGGVSASDSATLNFGNLTADSFALAFGQAIGKDAAVSVAAATTGPDTPNATAVANTKVTFTSAVVSPSMGAVAIAAGGTGGASSSGSPPTASALAFANATGQSSISFAQTAKPLSAAIATTTQSFARVSDTKVGGTIGGGLEWMMAPNWSVKVEGLYYDLGSVTVSTPLTSSINPIAAAASPGLAALQALGPPASTVATATGAAINKFVGPATVSNAASTHINFQGVIIRVGLNYHFNWGG
jgi:opacity protein-like surface antigen